MFFIYLFFINLLVIEGREILGFVFGFYGRGSCVCFEGKFYCYVLSLGVVDREFNRYSYLSRLIKFRLEKRKIMILFLVDIVG